MPTASRDWDDDVLDSSTNGRALEFDPSHYKLVRQCEVEEVDLSWRIISLYRDVKYDNVVLWYSDDEWEGINTSGAAEGPGSGYRMKSDGSVFDTDGVEIHMRPIVQTDPNPNPTDVPSSIPNPNTKSESDVVGVDVDHVVDPEKNDYIEKMIDVNDVVGSSDSDWDLFE